MSEQVSEPGQAPLPDPSVRTLAMVGYALQAAAFFVGITYLAAVVLAYVKRDDAAGTWLASHYRWQIRTFWYSLLWAVVGTLTLIIIVGFVILAADALWVIYRIIKGWLRLTEGKPMHLMPA